MKFSGVPPELIELLERLRRRGIPVTPLEIGRLQRLLAVPGALEPDRLQGLLAALLCKDESNRTAFAREYRAWRAQHEGPEIKDGAAVPETPGGSGNAGEQPLDRPSPGPGARALGAARLPWYRRLRALPLTQSQRSALLPLLLVLSVTGIAGALWLLTLWSESEPELITWSQPVRSAPEPRAGALCPPNLPDKPVEQVWAWEPVPDIRPWLALAGAALTLVFAGATARRLWAAPGLWLPKLATDPEADSAPRHALPPLRVRGNLVLDPALMREMVWSITRYVSEDPERDLDPEATVNATARAGGEPRLVQLRRTFPRQVWLWCDRKSAHPELLDRLVLETRRALDQAGLPVRVARFHGLPRRLVWEDNREPFAPACHEGAGAQALVAVLTDGAAMTQAWEGAGERPVLEALLRELRVWPRLVLVDLGAGELTRLGAGWRLPVRGGEGLAAWLAGRTAEPQALPPPDPAQLDLWAAACLQAPHRVDQVEAESLRRHMGLRLLPFHYPSLLERLDACHTDLKLAGHLLGRLARSQRIGRRGLPEGDGYLLRALNFWEARLGAAIEALPEADAATRTRVRIALATLRLWQNPSDAVESLAEIGGGRNRALIGQALAGLEPGRQRGPTWDWERLPVAVRFRLRSLGLGGRGVGQFGLRRGSRHHFALALLAGVAAGGLGWGLVRLVTHHRWNGVFADPRFRSNVLEVREPDLTWLGSPWRLTPVATLGPLATPYTWQWRPARNPRESRGGALLLDGGTRAFPIRPCTNDWPRRSLAVIAAAREDTAARKLAVRLLDRGCADRVLIAANWPARLDDLTQGVRVPEERTAQGRRPGDQLLVFLPVSDPSDVPKAVSDPVAALADRFDALAEIRGDLQDLASTLDFPGTRIPEAAWPRAQTRILAGSPQVSGGPEMDTDRFGVVWVRACGGTFLMGAPDSEDGVLSRYSYTPDWVAGERPAHPCLVEPFEIARTELTIGQAKAAGWSAGGNPTLPLTGVDFKDAEVACASLDAGQSGEVKSRLPTEAEWEFAARAGTATPWFFGDDDSSLGDHAWFNDNSAVAIHPAGGKQPNGLCVADMEGNVWEWVADCWDPAAYYSLDPVHIDPLVDKLLCDARVVRGGSFDRPPLFLRSAFRAVVDPKVPGAGLGLRCVRSRARQH